MRRMILTGAAVLAVGGALAGCGQSSPQAAPTAGNVAAPASAAPASAAPASSAPAGSSGPGYTVSCKMTSGPQSDYTGEANWSPAVTVANTSSSPMQLPDLNVVDQPLGFDFEFFDSSGALVGTASDGISPDNIPGDQPITTIEPGQSKAFTFVDSSNGESMVDEPSRATTCTALISGYSDAY